MFDIYNYSNCKTQHNICSNNRSLQQWSICLFSREILCQLDPQYAVICGQSCVFLLLLKRGFQVCHKPQVCEHIFPLKILSSILLQKEGGGWYPDLYLVVSPPGTASLLLVGRHNVKRSLLSESRDSWDCKIKFPSKPGARAQPAHPFTCSGPFGS